MKHSTTAKYQPYEVYRDMWLPTRAQWKVWGAHARAYPPVFRTKKLATLFAEQARRLDSVVKPRMSQHFAVLNLHVNRAGKRADKEFIAQFGQTEFDTHIKPHHDKGIMAIFRVPPTIHTVAWITLVTAYVNENREIK